MQFNGESNNQDLYSDARWWCGIENTDTTTFPLVDFTRSANFGLDKVTSIIMRNDKTWEWEDLNNTDLPIGTTTLLAGQADYSISSSHLKIKRARVMDSQGNYHILEACKREDLTDEELNEEDGLPRKYDKMGNSVVLHPGPASSSVTLASGLELQVQRGASHFAITDTGVQPGFASPFHRLISLYSAEDYCDINDLEKRCLKVRTKIKELEAECMEHYSSRDYDQKISVKVEQNDYGQMDLI